MTTKRIRRPTPARTAPHRGWTPPIPGAGQPNDAVPTREGGGPRERIEATVSKSVELGYKVIDEYLQQGQRTAARLNAGALTAEAVATEAQDLGTRVARYASDFFGAWMELLELAAAGRAARPDLSRPPAAADDATAPAAAAPPPPTAGTGALASRLRVDLDTRRAVHLRLDVHPDRMRGALRAHALRSADPRCGRLTDITCVVDDGAPLLRLRIPPEQRAGSYEGLLIDETTNRPVGSVRVTLEADRRGTQPSDSKRPRASRTSPSSKPSSKRR